MSRALLITGATGKQGGAAIKALVANNSDFQLLAITRNKNSASAQRLSARSPQVTLVEGDLNNTDALFKAAKNATTLPIWGVFSVQAIGHTKDSLAVEEQQGKSLVDAAIKAGVNHFVYSSVDRHGEDSFNNPTGVPHFISKHHIEQHLVNSVKGTGMSWTILRPVAFMDNLDGGFLGKVFASTWKGTLKSKPLQLIATDDIGTFAAKAFQEPHAFKDRVISLAGDELTFEQLETIFKQTIGSDIPTTWGIVSKMILAISKDLAAMFAFFQKPGYAANVGELKKIYPGLKDFKTWLATSVYASK